MNTPKGIYQGQDGVYRWVYEMNLYTNPTILLLVLKIFFWICFGLWVFSTLLQACDSVDFLDAFVSNTKFFGIITLGFLAFCTFGYYVYALIVGGKYCVLFEMDADGVMHKQMQKGVKKARLIGAITSLAGAASGNLTTVGTGIIAAAKTQMYSSFAGVKSVEAYPKRHVIKVNAPMNYNQVYADAGDFDFVLQYILDHIPQRVSRKYTGYRPQHTP